jgi:hypothetical protein
MSGLRLFAQQGLPVVLRHSVQDIKRSAGSLFGGGELLRNVRVYLGKSIDWLALHSFGLNEEC